MKKILMRILSVIMVLVLIVLADHIFIPKYVNENIDGSITSEFYNEKSDIDVVFLGPSTVHYCISPVYMWDKFGFTSYDRSNASQTVWQSYYMLKDTLRVKSPELVMLDVSFMRNGEEYIEEASNRKCIEGMKNIFDKWGAIKASMYKDEQPLSYYFPVLRYHSRWKDLKPEDFEYAFKRPLVTYNGYLMDFTVVKDQHLYETEPIEFDDFPEKSMEYLQKIMDLCKDTGIRLVLMKTPTFTNTWHDEYDVRMEEIASDNGISYINFCKYADEMGLVPAEDYIDDGEHTNIYGAQKVSEYIGEYIINNDYIHSEHEQDEALIKEWNEKLSRYEADKNRGE